VKYISKVQLFLWKKKLISKECSSSNRRTVENAMVPQAAGNPVHILSGRTDVNITQINVI
jgi:hypothetical protein